MKVLNLGCGADINRDKQEGDEYFNIDIQDLSGINIVCDVRDVSRFFEKNSIDKIIARHILEHLNFTDTEKALKHWNGLLKQNGLMVIECPDMEETCKYYLKGGIVDRKFIMQNKLFGEYDKQGNPLHKSGWDMKTLKDILLKTGYTKIELKWQRKCRFYVESRKNEIKKN